ncbi:MAG: hypothetical protein N3E40_00165, partial [Dehalococcoidia bacterium]|nr:hypothetical protein [Dehalococcoidia bacterium]
IEGGTAMKVVEMNTLFNGTAKLADLDAMVARAKELAGEGDDVVLTGAGPVWLYLAVAHALHGKARKLVYRSPATGDVLIFDHNPF